MGLYSYNSTHKVITVVIVLGAIVTHFYLNDGAEEDYYENKQVICTGKKIDNRNQGLWIWYYPDGTKMIQGNFEKGEREGVWSNFDEAGNLTMESTYRQNMLNGLQTQYDSTGKIIKQVEYQNDIVIKKLTTP